MFVITSMTTRLIRLKATARRTLCTTSHSSLAIENLQHFLNVSKARAELILLRHPAVSKYDRTQIRQVVETVSELGIDKKELADEPVIFSSLPVTLKYRYQILKECGFINVNASHLAKYLNLVRKKSIADLKESCLLLDSKIESRLVDIFKQWPTSRSKIHNHFNEKQYSLQDIRMKVVQRYLELVLDLSELDFLKLLSRYPLIKHRPLGCINETIMLLQNHILMPNEKIRNNLFLIHADPAQIKQLLYEVREIAGVDIKEILKMFPKLCTTNVKTIIATKKLFEEYGVKKEAQIRCFQIFTLSTETVRKRLERAKAVPEIQVFSDHPRMLRLIHYENKALKRLDILHKRNKKCLSLNILSGSTAHYKVYEKAPGDRTKGNDLLFGIAEELGSKFTPSKLRDILKRHPFWINIPLVHAKFVLKKLSSTFSMDEIFENCLILFYPWDRIELFINMFTVNGQGKINDHTSINTSINNLDESILTNSKILSLCLYMLEKDHYFSGNGVWSDGKLNESTLDESDSSWSNYCNRQLQN